MMEKWERPLVSCPEHPGAGLIRQIITSYRLNEAGEVVGGVSRWEQYICPVCGELVYQEEWGYEGNRRVRYISDRRSLRHRLGARDVLDRGAVLAMSGDVYVYHNGKLVYSTEGDDEAFTVERLEEVVREHGGGRGDWEVRIHRPAVDVVYMRLKGEWVRKEEVYDG